MKRTQVLLIALGAVAVVVLFVMLVVQPQREALAEVEDQIAAEQQQQAMLTAEIERLRLVREDAPGLEAELAAAEAIVPRDPGLPGALRQLQLAGDESGLVLRSISTSRPVDLGVGEDGLSAIDVSVQLSGGYFQIVDFLRRVEDPRITPRGLIWNSANMSRGEYPELNVALNGRLYAVIETPPPPEPEPDPADADLDDDVDGDGDEDDQAQADAEESS